VSIRINPDITPDLLAAIAQDRQAENTALQQLSTGLQVNQLSDNPAAAASDVLVNVQTGQDDQYLQNLSDLQSQFQTIDSTFSSVVQAVTQAISLGVEGANGNLTASNQQAVAQQLTGIRNQVLSLANQTYEGNYVFAGTATSTQPFTLDPTQPNGVVYNGNEGVNSVELASGLKSAINVPGDQIFTNASGNLIGSLNNLITAVQNNSGIAAANTSLSQAFSELNNQRVFYGNALQQIQSAQAFLNSDKLQLSQQQNSLVGADMSVSATNFQQASLATEAILSATGQILSSMNLLNFLK
jgi:flagellar hook-associated protein 3 FlgL